jgi:hypothetical protein
MSLIYKILFEVKVLHEFYLTESKGETIFDLPAQKDRLTFLRDKFDAERESINSEVAFVVPPESESVFSNHHLKLLTTYSGFKVGIEVNALKQPDGSIFYKPKIALPNDLNVPVSMIKKNGFWESFSNRTMQAPVDAGYYFSNENITGSKSFPLLAAEISLFDAGATYEQGQPVKFAANDYREFYKDDAGNVKWISLSAAGFANDNDRLLVPANFYYSFPPAANVTVADIRIKDADGNVVKDNNGISISEFHFADTNGLRKVRIGIDPSRLSLLPGNIDHKKALYTMTITGNGGYNKIQKIFFISDQLKAAGAIGLVNIKPKVTNSALNIIDGTGKLLTIKQPDGTVNPLPPVFEIRFSSRRSFWRYTNSRKKGIKTGLHPDFLIWKNGVLISTIPRPLTYVPTLFRKPDNSLYYLPAPEPYAGIKIENDKIYSDITVSESDLFPLAP